jgi:transposase InsO family protein
VAAESLLLKHQLLILTRGRERASNLRPIDRVIAGLCTLVIRPGRLLRLAIALRPSWLSILGHAKDSLWSIDLFRCESLTLKSHWVLVVMDQYTRRIVGFGVYAGSVDGFALCRMFNRAIRGTDLPKYVSSDNDPLFRFHRWKTNLRILEVTEVNTVPYLPISHPFFERLIGTIRREYLDVVPLWAARDLENKLLSFRDFYNDQRCHYALDGDTPSESAGRSEGMMQVWMLTRGRVTAEAYFNCRSRIE